MMGWRLAIAAALLGALGFAPAYAQNNAPVLGLSQSPRAAPLPAEAADEPSSLFVHWRVGVLANNLAPRADEVPIDGLDLTVEIGLGLPIASKPIWIPNLHFGGTLNTSGQVSQAYGELVWASTLEEVLWFTPFGKNIFLEIGLGVSAHDGLLHADEITDARRTPLFGCRVVFREHGSMGVRLSERGSFLLTLSHISNADSRACSNNEGLTSAGMFYQYDF